MSKEPEFAEIYTLTEKIRLFVVGILGGAAVFIGAKWWFFPWLSHFAETAHCRSVFGINGLLVLWNGTFIGLPLFSLLLSAFILGRRGYKILRDQQIPLQDEKVFKPTKIQRGRAAEKIGYLHLIPAVCLLVLFIFYIFQTTDMQNNTVKDTKLNCENKVKI